MGDTAPELLKEEIYMHTWHWAKANGLVEKRGSLLHRKGVFCVSMINATGVPFPFSPTSPLWFCLATALKTGMKRPQLQEAC